MMDPTKNYMLYRATPGLVDFFAAMSGGEFMVAMAKALAIHDGALLTIFPNLPEAEDANLVLLMKRKASVTILYDDPHQLEKYALGPKAFATKTVATILRNATVLTINCGDTDPKHYGASIACAMIGGQAVQIETRCEVEEDWFHHVLKLKPRPQLTYCGPSVELWTRIGLKYGLPSVEL